MKKRNIIVLILLLAIGFASVATTLYINGTANIAANKDDFNIYFSEAMLDDENVTDKVIINNGKNIKFETKTLKSIGEYTTLEYEVTNASKNYDASVTMKCSFDEEQNEFVYITNTMINKVIKARTAEKGSIVITLSNSVVEDFSLDIACELEFNAIERNEIAEGDIVSSDINTYSFYGYFVDEEDTPIKNANLVMYSEEPKYIKTDTRGYFYISGLEKGEHELYYVKDKTIDELKALSKDKIK
ncbi:MAG: hypothetical protein J1F35_03220, partial [Erysipelotrichales bacterium]|nr:hypothetical protein [Erysipelotrichales bacterium]